MLYHQNNQTSNYPLPVCEHTGPVLQQHMAVPLSVSVSALHDEQGVSLLSRRVHWEAQGNNNRSHDREQRDPETACTTERQTGNEQIRVPPQKAAAEQKLLFPHLCGHTVQRFQRELDRTWGQTRFIIPLLQHLPLKSTGILTPFRGPPYIYIVFKYNNLRYLKTI